MPCQSHSAGVDRWHSTTTAHSGPKPTLRGLEASDGMWGLSDEEVH